MLRLFGLADEDGEEEDDGVWNVENEHGSHSSPSSPWLGTRLVFTPDGQPKFVPVDIYSPMQCTEDNGTVLMSYCERQVVHRSTHEIPVTEKGKLTVLSSSQIPYVRRADEDRVERRRTLPNWEKEVGGKKGVSSGKLQVVVEPCSHDSDGDAFSVIAELPVVVELGSHGSKGDARLALIEIPVVVEPCSHGSDGVERPTMVEPRSHRVLILGTVGHLGIPRWTNGRVWVLANRG